MSLLRIGVFKKRRMFFHDIAHSGMKGTNEQITEILKQRIIRSAPNCDIRFEPYIEENGIPCLKAFIENPSFEAMAIGIIMCSKNKWAT